MRTSKTILALVMYCICAQAVEVPPLASAPSNRRAEVIQELPGIVAFMETAKGLAGEPLEKALWKKFPAWSPACEMEDGVSTVSLYKYLVGRDGIFILRYTKGAWTYQYFTGEEDALPIEQGAVDSTGALSMEKKSAVSEPKPR